MRRSPALAMRQEGQEGPVVGHDRVPALWSDSTRDPAQRHLFSHFKVTCGTWMKCWFLGHQPESLGWTQECAFRHMFRWRCHGSVRAVQQRPASPLPALL